LMLKPPFACALLAVRGKRLWAVMSLQLLDKAVKG
jgi:hypothetical protein